MEKIIDLSSIKGFGSNYLKGEKIIKSIKENINDYDIVIIPISILNILECSDYYVSEIRENIIEIDDCYYVGYFLNKEVFIDVSILENVAILSYNKQIKREMKLNSIINGNLIKEDLRLRFIY